jgi:hypothetical protein
MTVTGGSTSWVASLTAERENWSSRWGLAYCAVECWGVSGECEEGVLRSPNILDLIRYRKGLTLEVLSEGLECR